MMPPKWVRIQYGDVSRAPDIFPKLTRCTPISQRIGRGGKTRPCQGLPASWAYPHERLRIKKTMPECRPGRTCIFSKSNPGSPAIVPRGIARCMFCDPTRFEVIIGAGGSTAASIIRSLSMFNKKNGTVFKEAMEDPANHKLFN